MNVTVIHAEMEPPVLMELIDIHVSVNQVSRVLIAKQTSMSVPLILAPTEAFVLMVLMASNANVLRDILELVA